MSTRDLSLRRTRGFTLIETLVALVVVAIAAAVILAMTRSLYHSAERRRAHSHAITRLSNDVARLDVPAWRKRPFQIDAESVRLSPAAGESSPPAPSLSGRNFAVRGGYPLPPVAIAFTPIQEFTLSAGGDSDLELRFLAPSLPYPADASSPTALPASGGK